MRAAPAGAAGTPSVKDSVRILGICRKINRTLNQSQKVVVLMRLYELVDADNRYTDQRMNIINTVAEVFRIPAGEIRSIELFVRKKDEQGIDDKSILVIRNMSICPDCNEDIDGDDLSSMVMVIRIASVDLYFIKHYSQHLLSLNGLPLLNGKIYTMAKGSSVRYRNGQPLYYSDIASHYQAESEFTRITLVSENLTCIFGDGEVALNSINISESEGSLVGIMGSSGVGKTTLLNILSGIQEPTSGNVRINGIDVHSKDSGLEGVIGYVPHDDMLIEELTVFENLYFAAGLCFSDMTGVQIEELVSSTLQSLGLYEKKDLKVGTSMNKVISGGQRKRLNIALELIREPSILFLDEPTTGLSSRDSENVIDLLRELAFKGKLIVTVIHQPSSELFKLFDRILILDQGGEMVYAGNPIEALIYFKTLDSQIDSNIGECPACGNINPETIFNIIETEVVDEFGKYNGLRKTSPADWAREYRIRLEKRDNAEASTAPPSNMSRPGRIKQFMIFARRDIKTKLSNRQYILLTLFEAPVLALVLSFIIRHIPDPSSSQYVFRENENIPVFIFMSLIVALFLGLITSSEEIFRDRKILKREQFLNLSHHSYLSAKVIILFFISAVQVLLFVLIANNVLGVKGLTFHYWFALFTTAAMANLVGLNISRSFNSAITIYIVVPLLMIPMMVLSGAMFPFDKMNRSLGSVDKVPVIADIMPTKWTYEALMVTQAKDNEYDRLVYNLNKTISISEYNIVERLPAIKSAINKTLEVFRQKGLSDENPAKLNLIRNEFNEIAMSGIKEPFRQADMLNPAGFNHLVAESAIEYINELNDLHIRISNSAEIRLDFFIEENRESLDNLYDRYHNIRLNDIVTKIGERYPILEYRDRLIQNSDPIYNDPSGNGLIGIRTHFLAPTKRVFGMTFDTFPFNMVIVWFMSLSLYLLLYFDILPKFLNFFNRK